MNCSSLTDPNNGMMTCSLGDDEVPSYEDTCSFTCNTGYELTGSDTTTCQSDGSWSGSDDVCRRGMFYTFNVDNICIYVLDKALPRVLYRKYSTKRLDERQI